MLQQSIMDTFKRALFPASNVKSYLEDGYKTVKVMGICVEPGMFEEGALFHQIMERLETAYPDSTVYVADVSLTPAVFNPEDGSRWRGVFAQIKVVPMECTT
jgi:hypothetical protein